MCSNKRATVAGVLLIAVFIVGLAGCQKDSGITAAADPAAQTVSMQGDTQAGVQKGIIGLVQTLLGEVIKLVLPLDGAVLNVRTTSFAIPPRALVLPTVISYSLWSATPPPGLIDAPGRLVRFGPEGLTFSKTCTLTVPFSELNLGTINPQLLKCYYYNENTGRYEVQPTTVDMQNQRFIVTISHFSQYAFGRLQ